MTSATDLLVKQITQKIPGASVAVASAGGLYELVVTAPKFAGMDRADRAALVYGAIERVPLELLARVAAIECRT